ncbi:MAG: hypothetical protein ACM3X7_02575 [Solirubrobacterales bacterium]
MKNEVKKSREEYNNSLVAGGKEYYGYLKDLKKDTDSDEYSASFMTF